MGINVRECLGTADPIPMKPQMIRKRDWDADLAYERLKTVRRAQDVLKEGINRSSIEIPQAVRDEYEKIWIALRSVERMEAETVKWGR